MTLRKKGILLAIVHVCLVACLGGKFMLDRARYPRVWAQTAPYDPYMPIRGRYVSLRLRVTVEGNMAGYAENASLKVVNNELVAVADARGTVMVTRGGNPPNPRDFFMPPTQRDENRQSSGFVLREPVLFFIPEHASDPSTRKAGEELWAEVTVPPKGPPRPIRLGIKKDGAISPLPLD